MSQYYDESIFGSGFTIRDYRTVYVNNEADRYLASRLDKRVTLATERTNECVTGEPGAINLNPRLPCAGTNLYTMNAYNKPIVRHVPHYPIRVTRDRSERRVVPVYVGEPLARSDAAADSILHDTNPRLDDFSSAVMIKYFSVSSLVNITYRLYTTICRHFEDGLKRFYFDNEIGDEQRPGLVQLVNGELLIDNIPAFNAELVFDLSGPPISI